MNNDKITAEYSEAHRWLEENQPNWSKHDYPKKYYVNSLLADRINSDLFNKESMRPKKKSGTKYIGEQEKISENLIHFVDLKTKYSELFKIKGIEAIGQKKFEIYSNFLKIWTKRHKEKGERRSIRIIENDLYNYILNKYGKMYCQEKKKKYSYLKKETLLDSHSIHLLLNLQSELIELFLNEVHDNIYSNEETNIKDFYIHRGINPKSLSDIKVFYDEKLPFKERSCLTSYSISFNVAEKFAMIDRNFREDGLPENYIIISGKYNLFYKRIFGCSLLNEELYILQFEFLTIPSWQHNYLIFEGKNDNIYDFLLDNKFKNYAGGLLTQLNEDHIA